MDHIAFQMIISILAIKAMVFNVINLLVKIALTNLFHIASLKITSVALQIKAFYAILYPINAI